MTILQDGSPMFFEMEGDIYDDYERKLQIDIRMFELNQFMNELTDLTKY